MSDQREDYRRPLTHPEPYAFRPRADGTIGCRECGDSDWVEQSSTLSGAPTVRPCSRCLPTTFERWVNGFPQTDRRHGETAFVPEPTRPAVSPIPTQEAAF